jgi:hypothetical protein
MYGTQGGLPLVARSRQAETRSVQACGDRRTERFPFAAAEMRSRSRWGSRTHSVSPPAMAAGRPSVRAHAPAARVIRRPVRCQYHRAIGGWHRLAAAPTGVV